MQSRREEKPGKAKGRREPEQVKGRRVEKVINFNLTIICFVHCLKSSCFGVSLNYHFELGYLRGNEMRENVLCSLKECFCCS